MDTSIPDSHTNNPASRQRPIRCMLALLVSTTLVALVAGCNTVEGAGKDVEKAGEAVQDAAK